MDKEFEVYVTQSDIDAGCRLESDNCPVARAVKSATGAIFASVTPMEIVWKMPSGVLYYDYPHESVRSFTRLFDKGCHCCPFKFVLNPKVWTTLSVFPWIKKS